MDANDVGMGQVGDELHLAPKARAAHAGGEIAGEDFDHDLSIEREVGGKIDSRHPTAAKLPFDTEARGKRAWKYVAVSGGQLEAADSAWCPESSGGRAEWPERPARSTPPATPPSAAR